MSRIAEESIRQVIDTVSIVDLISSYFPLKRAGTSFKACCPFHSERTPSFTVSPTRNAFHCFGCGKGGNAIRFVMDYENLPFAEAVRKLAQKFSITLIEEASSPENAAATATRVRLLALHRDVCTWMHQLLLRSDSAAAARHYLKSRNISADIAKRWLIGYAPAEPSTWRQWARSSGYEESLLTEGGIFSPAGENQTQRGGYPRFRHRVMFPIRNDHGDVIAFSGRVLDPDASPAKYINSPATPLFSKSHTFFGLDKSKRAILKSQSAIICEGQIDMIMCFENGIENIVAPLGTAFTPDHARLLKRHTDKVILCFDSDNAGRKAAHSCFAELASHDIFVSVAALPQGEDPDSLLRSGGPSLLRSLLDSARDYIDFLIDSKAPAGLPDDPRDRMRILSEITGAIARTRNRITQESSLQRTALRLAVPTEELRRMVSAHARHLLRQRDTAPQPQTDHPPSATDSSPLIIDSPAVRLLIQLSLTDPEARTYLLALPRPYPWEDLPGGTLLSRSLDAGISPDSPESSAAWLSALPHEEEIAASALLLSKPPGQGKDAAHHAVLSLRILRNRRSIDLLQLRQRQPQIPNDEILIIMQEVARLQKENLDLAESMRNIPMLS
jgi:DNA primase